MLREWQKRVSEGVRGGASVTGGLFRLGEERFHLYRNGHWLRVSESLLEDFPLTARLLGQRAFGERVRAFLPSERGYELELGEVSGAFSLWLGKGANAALTRALALDLLAVLARRAPEVVAGKKLGLHPSARFFAEGRRVYAFWRDEQGQVLRERISAEWLRVLENLRVPVFPADIAKRLAGHGLDFSTLQEMLADCTEAGLLVYQQ